MFFFSLFAFAPTRSSVRDLSAYHVLRARGLVPSGPAVRTRPTDYTEPSRRALAYSADIPRGPGLSASSCSCPVAACGLWVWGTARPPPNESVAFPRARIAWVARKIRRRAAQRGTRGRGTQRKRRRADPSKKETWRGSFPWTAPSSGTPFALALL